MRELASFLGWIACLILATLGFHWIGQSIGAPADVSLILACIPIIGAFAVGLSEDNSTIIPNAIRYCLWFFGGFSACLATAYLLTLLV